MLKSAHIRQQAKLLAENRTSSYQQIHAHEAIFVKLGKVLNIVTRIRVNSWMVHTQYASEFILSLPLRGQAEGLHEIASTIVENPLQIGPFFAKQTQFS